VYEVGGESTLQSKGWGPDQDSSPLGVLL
jgi:hypothetical protein